MKKYYKLSLVFFLFTTVFYAQVDEKEQVELLLSTLSRYHYEPKTISKEELAVIFTDYLVDLDPKQTFFTNSEFSNLVEIANGEVTTSEKVINFHHQSLKLYIQRLLGLESVLENYQKSKLNFSDKSILKLPQDKRYILAETEAVLKERYQKKLLHETIVKMYNWASAGSEDVTALDSVLKFEEQTKKALYQAKSFYVKIAKEHPEDIKAYLYEDLLSALVAYFDPHSAFFSPDQKKDFEGMLSKEIMLFGFSYNSNDKGEYEITKLSPGSPAWKCGVLNEGDVILEVEVTGGKRLIASELSSKQFSEELGKIENQSATFTIRKPNAVIKKVVLKKEAQVVEENIIRGYRLVGPKNIGYISLPSFYTDMGSAGNLGCANDVAKEIIKLQQDGPLDGLILDLRYNGGGSLQEAVDLAGIFIDAGPILVYDNSNGQAETIKDRNRGSAFTGELAVLVNAGSASASEVVAAALQDYNRAIVVGQPTYGKATAQVILPVDTTLLLGKGKLGGEAMGYVKVTQAVLYRVTGSSNQKLGVLPTVEVPELLDNLVEKESEYAHAITAKSINKKVYYYPLPALNSSTAALKSKERISASSTFNKLKEINEQYQVVIDAEKVSLSLNIAEYVKTRNRLKTIIADFENNLAATNLYQIQSSKFDMEVNTQLNTDQNEYISDLSKDYVLEEAFQILNSIIK